MKKTAGLILILLFILSSCGRDRLDVDVDKVSTPPLQVFRLEQDLFRLDESNFEQQSSQIRNKYGVLYDHYLMNPHRLTGVGDSLYKPTVLAFTHDKDVREAYEYTRKIYTPAAMESIVENVELMRKRFRYHFPTRALPTRFVTCTTGWNYAFAYMDSALIVGLDMYLGDTTKFYQMLRYPQYQTRKMDVNHLLPDIARGWMLSEFDNKNAENTLLHHTIFYGKLFYAVEALLPTTADSLIIGYTSEQMKTCDKYEKQYWSYFAEKNRLYESSIQTIRELTSEGPFTAAISKDAPPRIAMWIGWQIVRSYMKHNDKVTVSELMNEQDAQKILNKSKYRP